MGIKHPMSKSMLLSDVLTGCAMRRAVVLSFNSYTVQRRFKYASSKSTTIFFGALGLLKLGIVLPFELEALADLRKKLAEVTTKSEPYTRSRPASQSTLDNYLFPNLTTVFNNGLTNSFFRF